VLLRITQKAHDDEDQGPDRRTGKLSILTLGLGIGANSAIPLAVMNERSSPADADVNFVPCARCRLCFGGTGSANATSRAPPRFQTRDGAGTGRNEFLRFNLLSSTCHEPQQGVTCSGP